MACASSFNATATKTDKPKSKPFSIRLTDSEKCLLTARAGRTPLGAFIRDLILAGELQAKRRRGVNPLADHVALARVLAGLGHSRVADHLAELARAAHISALPASPETQAAILDACAAVAAMRDDLIRALGLSDGAGA